MDPSQLLAFFERATGSSLDVTKESLEKIIQNVDEDGDGLVRFSPRSGRSPEMYPIDVEDYVVHVERPETFLERKARQSSVMAMFAVLRSRRQSMLATVVGRGL